MQLIGMLDSPCVRSVAISPQRLGLLFTHQSVSVLRGFARFEAINPVVEALQAHADAAEGLSAVIAAPHGEGVYPVARP